jgi:hypothetical protein
MIAINNQITGITKFTLLESRQRPGDAAIAGTRGLGILKVFVLTTVLQPHLKPETLFLMNGQPKCLLFCLIGLLMRLPI